MRRVPGLALVSPFLIAVLHGCGSDSPASPEVDPPGPSLAKPVEIIQWSNGFPSGPHFNLNIHGKKADYLCDPAAGGGSVFVPEYGTDEIDLVQNKKSSVGELVAHDPCGRAFDGDPVLVQLPAGEYQVYARILAKPSKYDDTREVVFHPKLVEACNDTGEEGFGDSVDCDYAFLMGTGVLTKDGFFELDEQGFERTAGRSKALDVTGAFTWSGYACDQVYDTNGDGEITVDDVTDLDADGDVDEADLLLYLDANCSKFQDEWIFNIADLVVYGWDYQNAGSKLVQVRFYPRVTTVFD